MKTIARPELAESVRRVRSKSSPRHTEASVNMALLLLGLEEATKGYDLARMVVLDTVEAITKRETGKQQALVRLHKRH